ncbi:MAG: cytochrome C [Nitrospinota bacterium]|nr:cytochrome C [Nitrospinota bacterium]
MKALLKISVFSLAVICGFAGYTTYGLPLIVPEAPPVEEKLGGDLTMEQFIAVGDKIYNGKGTCPLCHNPVGGRAPLLEGVAGISMERIADERYAGKATDIEGYIRESLIDTSAFVVEGFGKKGTNDTVSPMPDVSKGAIGLSEVELNAVIAYLQDIGGVEVTVPLPTGDEGGVGGEEEAGGEIKLAETAAEAFGKFGCTACHMAPGIEDGGDIGPDLGALAELAGSRKEGMDARAYVIESIMDPNAFVVQDYDADMMPVPEDYDVQMTLAEMNLIVDAMLGKE